MIYSSANSVSAVARIEVRFNECDPLGIVWHGNYVNYFQEGREAFGKKYGLDYMNMYHEGYATPIVHLETDFKRTLQYKDIGEAALAQVAEDGEEDLHLVLGEGGGGLVEDEDAGVFGEGFDDFDELLFADAEAGDGRGGVDGDAESLEEFVRLTVDFFPVDERRKRPKAGAARLAAEADVFGDGHFFDEGEFLVDDGEARALGVGDAVEMRGLAGDGQLAVVAAVRVEAAEELDERGFARAVFAAERVDFAGPQVEGNVAQGGHAGEAFGDAAGGEHFVGFHFTAEAQRTQRGAEVFVAVVEGGKGALPTSANSAPLRLKNRPLPGGDSFFENVFRLVKAVLYHRLPHVPPRHRDHVHKDARHFHLSVVEARGGDDGPMLREPHGAFRGLLGELLERFVNGHRLRAPDDDGPVRTVHSGLGFVVQQ